MGDYRAEPCFMPGSVKRGNPVLSERRSPPLPLVFYEYLQAIAADTHAGGERVLESACDGQMRAYARDRRPFGRHWIVIALFMYHA